MQDNKSPENIKLSGLLNYYGSIINVGVWGFNIYFLQKNIDIFPKSQYNKVATPKKGG